MTPTPEHRTMAEAFLIEWCMFADCEEMKTSVRAEFIDALARALTACASAARATALLECVEIARGIIAEPVTRGGGPAKELAIRDALSRLYREAKKVTIEATKPPQ